MYIFLLRDGNDHPCIFVAWIILTPPQEPLSLSTQQPTSNTQLRSPTVSAIVIQDLGRQQMHRCWYRVCSISVSTWQRVGKQLISIVYQSLTRHWKWLMSITVRFWNWSTIFCWSPRWRLFDTVGRLISFDHRVKFKSVITVVHILSGDLILHKRTLDPIKTLIYGLRRYDLDRCAALSEPGSAAKVEGFMSHKAKIYLVRRVLWPELYVVNGNVNYRRMYTITWSTSWQAWICLRVLRKI